MKKLVLIFFAVALVFFLGACERQETQTTGPQGVEQTPPPATAQPPGQTTQREPAGTTDQTASTAGQPSGMQEQPATSQTQQPGEQSTAMQPSSDEQAAGKSGQTGGQEFLGQSPEFGNAPETIVLQAKNGNVTLPHKVHAEMMDCKTCHGDSPPGPIEGFSKDQAHALCQGCHKEKGAGPTKCQECHKKS